MPLRKCASCGGDLPAGATARAKFCSATCRKRASRSGHSDPPLKIVRDAEPTPEPRTRLAALELAASRLERLLDQSDPRSAAALNKEYRETLRELDSLRKETEDGGGRGRSAGDRRPFNASAV